MEEFPVSMNATGKLRRQSVRKEGEELLVKRRWIVLLLACLCCLTAFAPVAQAKAIDMDTFYIRFDGDCNVRDEPNLDGRIIGSAPEGGIAPFCLDAEEDERGVRWYLISYGEQMGWVSSKYAVLTNGWIEPVYYQADWERSVYYELKDKNWLLSKPSADGKVLYAMFPGETATNLGYFYFDENGNSWYYVIYGGEAGWISAEDTIGVMQ